LDSSTGFIDAPEFDRHTNGPGHPECPARLHAVREGVARAGLESRLVCARPQPVDRALLETVHSPAYVRRIEQLCLDGGGLLDPDTSVVRDSWMAALLAAGAVQDAVRRVLSREWRRAFCAVRPPGHHAPPGRAMGFCVFGNAAVGAETAIVDGSAQRVAILDWDVHHGNGTQAIFWERPDVFYASWHQYPLYPGTGTRDESGFGAGAGTTLNCPLPAGAGDREYLRAWQEQIRPALEKFAPELVIISAGFDADLRDPLAGLCVTPEGFSRLSREVIEWSDSACDGRVVSVLEGGYSLEALGEDVALHIETLL